MKLHRIIIASIILMMFTSGKSQPQLKDLIEQSCLEYRVSPTWAAAVFFVESTFRPDIVTVERPGVRARGLGQLLLPTARIYEPEIQPHELLDAKKNIDISVRHLAWLQKKYPGDIVSVLKSYNGGHPYKDNAHYYQKVLKARNDIISGKIPVQTPPF